MLGRGFLGGSIEKINIVILRKCQKDTHKTQKQFTTGLLFNSSVQYNLFLKINNLTVPLQSNELTIMVKTSP